ncbi:Uracil-DNA glycosylase [Muriicola jejuensis]|uniref:Uracil-DNA glycosylase n=1 Tax=Muriicola jejuensis TaxID=504488 RepID=A0A6P0UDR9_9FLAO|nr:uracil-DNA glycosylase [Muriicola jejuensis]NER11345.1 uracil-DNA glycosylase [Muriicola jejuensis]SMP21227.1 Uracil-DNA glycosylase [Muriicola jejuensis]
MKVDIHQSWKPYLEEEFNQPYFGSLAQFVRDEYSRYTCYPRGNRIFAAFDHSAFDHTKVVILGQDPYHGPGQANGLCFSVREGISHPPSLINIFKEVEQDVGIPYPKSGNLERWADQGILLLNAILTVRAGQAGSHQNKGWEQFTDAVIRILSEHRQDLVFLLWGGYAKKKASLVDRRKHHVLTSGHPSPLSANRGLWFGNKHFSSTNEFLKAKGEKPIAW